MSGNIKGIFYGVSTGPGDPELMTVKAVRILKEADVIAAARVMGKQETALEIAKQARLEGVRSLRESGLHKARIGMTSLEEVLACTNE